MNRPGTAAATPRRARVAATAAATVAAMVAAVAISAGAGDASAQDLTRLFPEEADVYTPGPGLVRLPLPPRILSATGPDLADLRLFDRQGREVPYLVDPGVPPGFEVRERIGVEGEVLDLERQEIPREDRKSLSRETYVVTFPPRPPAGADWALEFRSERPRFVRTVTVRGRNADGAWVTLVPRASLVRLGQRTVDRTAIPLPGFDGREIVVEIEGEEGFFLEPTLRYVGDRGIDGAGTLEIPLGEKAKRAAPGRTVIEVDRPPGLIPARLRIATSTPALDRRVEVFDVEPSGRASAIGIGRLVRVPRAPKADGARDESADGSGAEADGVETDRGSEGAARLADLDLAIGVARGARLRIEIADGDSPPLADLAIAALVRQPALIFALEARGDGPAGTLAFGGRRAWLPRYDIAGLFRDGSGTLRGAPGEPVEGDPAALPLATLGPVRPNPRFDASPALSAVMRPGAAVDPGEWLWQRPIAVPPSPEGLVRIRLGPEDLAHARGDRADLRVIDADGRQWPWVLAPAVATETVDLRVEGQESRRGRSRWSLGLPAAPLQLDRIVLRPETPVLHRPYRLVATGVDGEERVIAEGALAQNLQRPAPIEIAFAPQRVERLELVVDDGDDAPLALGRVTAPLALPEILLAAPAGDYRLLAGNPDATMPQYEVARARDTLLALPSEPASGGAGSENPAWTGTPGGRVRSELRLQQVAVWAVIAVAVLVLAATTLRLVRRSD